MILIMYHAKMEGRSWSILSTAPATIATFANQMDKQLHLLDTAHRVNVLCLHHPIIQYSNA